MRLHWLLALILLGCVIVGRIGKDLGRMLRRENSIFPLESWGEVLDAVFWDPALLLVLEKCLNCSELPFGGSGRRGRISADGFMRSSQRRIAFPRFRPTSMSLCWMLLCTDTATLNTSRVRLQNTEGRRESILIGCKTKVDWSYIMHWNHKANLLST